MALIIFVLWVGSTGCIIKIGEFTINIATAKNNINESMNLLCAWLAGSCFSGFKFDIGFSLYFSRESESSYSSHALPWLSELQLLGEWWFGSKSEWLNKVNRFGDGVVLDEPVKAFRLAKLRWAKGATVKNATYENGVITIYFENDTSVSVSLESDNEYALMLKETGVSKENSRWLVVCDSDDMFYKTPGN